VAQSQRRFLGMLAQVPTRPVLRNLNSKLTVIEANPSMLVGQFFSCHSCKAVENTLVLEIYLGYAEQVFVLPFRSFHFSFIG
jgi:hypothetical protein